MFRIGIFSKMNRVTIKTLRYYDQIGLLKPTRVDEWTNYRYYSAKNITQLHRIIALKQIGFSIKEIKEILNKNLSSKDLIKFLEKKKNETETLSLEIKEKANRIDSYLNVLKQENIMENNVIIKELPEVIVASMRKVIANYDEFNEFYPVMGKLMEKHGVKCATPGYCFSLYHDGEYKEKDIDVEICESVDKIYESKDGITYKQIPSTKAACILHKGPYTTIGKSYEAIFSWIERNGYQTADMPRESYIDGCWNKENPEDWLTEIQIPVEKKC